MPDGPLPEIIEDPEHPWLIGVQFHPELKSRPISEVDYARRDCGDDRTIEEWLKQIVGERAKSIRWAGGKCLLAIKERATPGPSGARTR